MRTTERVASWLQRGNERFDRVQREQEERIARVLAARDAEVLRLLDAEVRVTDLARALGLTRQGAIRWRNARGMSTERQGRPLSMVGSQTEPPTPHDRGCLPPARNCR